MISSEDKQENDLNAIAVIGMSGRFPKADSIDQFWNNLIEGKDCIDSFTIEEIKEAGVSESIINNEKYIRRGGRINNPDKFDASFFGYTPREASYIDPQHRIFLQCGWEAIESAGYDVSRLNGRVGVFAGCGMNHYLIHNIMSNTKSSAAVNEIQMVLGNDKDFLTTRLSYKLNLKGPSFDIQTACSTSLVAVHVACQNLLMYQCDMALAGGAFLQIPWWNGYMLADGDIRSPDGICRPFCAHANGTIFGEGAGVVILKRLDEALKDEDFIYAVIRGSAINNDGSLKAGYAAPSVEGQAEVIITALESAQIHPSKIAYIEAHGTGTSLGDPIEFSSLTKAFRQYTNSRNYCGIGSVKGSIGHLDAAAGIAGFIKTALALYHKQIPPSLNAGEINPLLNIENSPFYITAQKSPWKTVSGTKCYAGVSSLGVGGTNAHVILEEAPLQTIPPSSRNWHIFPLSAKSDECVKRMAHNLAEHLGKNQQATLADTAYTLQNGRQNFSCREFTVAQTRNDAINLLNNLSEKTGCNHFYGSENQKVVFMFSGQGSQYIDMGIGLYQSENSFKTAFDLCCNQLLKTGFVDLRKLVFTNTVENSTLLAQTSITQPLLFAFEYALAKMYENLGIVPSEMIGHSIGEYVAACLSGVFSLEEALYLVSQRGRLMHAQPPGGMLSISASEQEVSTMLEKDLEIAVVNSPGLCVVSGPLKSVELFEAKLSNLNIESKKLHTSHAFHSSMMNEAVVAFNSVFKEVSLKSPSIPFISNVTGTWVKSQEVQDPAYWGKHLRNAVKFSDGINQLLNSGNRLFLEIGPGNTLTSFVNKIAAHWNTRKGTFVPENVSSICSVRHAKMQIDDTAHMLNSIGQLWSCGINIAWKSLYKDENRRRIPLPTYPFEPKKCWVEPDSTLNCGIGLTKDSPKTLETSSAISSEHPSPTLTQKFESEDSNQKQGTLSTLEDSVHAIWEELLGIDSVNPDSNFFELGGDSIWAAQLLSRIRNTTGVELSIGMLYKAPTIKELVAEIEKIKKSDVKKTYSGPVRSEHDRGIPLSSSQLRLWFLHKLDPDSPTFNLAVQFDITGKFEIDRARNAIDKVVARHDALRTTFEDTENGPAIWVHPEQKFEFEFLDLREIIVNNDNAWNKEVITRSIKPYDFKSGPLLRILIIGLEESHYILAVMTHHIISDGWSMGVFLRDFSFYYASSLTGTSSELPQLRYRFADFAKWQSEHSNVSNNNGMEYWKNLLSGQLPILELPSDKSRPASISSNGSSVQFKLSLETSSKLERLSRSEQSTLFSILLSVYYVLLSKYSGQSDIIIGAPVANRNSVDEELLFGFFLNMIPLRLSCDTGQSFRQLLQKTKTIVHDAFTYQDIPFNVLVDMLKLQRDLNHTPIFQTMFAFQNFPIEPEVINGMTITPLLTDRGASEYDVSLYMWNSGNGLIGNFEYSTELFDSITIERLATHFVNIANFVAEKIDTPIAATPILSEFERNVLISDWNNTDAPIPNNKCIHDLFADAVKKGPNSVAIITNGHSYTYQQLDEASDFVAGLLTAKGVNAGELVGISLHRHFGMVAGLLGILKAGAAYVPLDPNYPRERLTYMIENADMRYIVTQKSISSDLFQSPGNVSVILIDPELNDLKNGKQKKSCASISPQHIAYTIYTSGSTGKPKGVKIRHQSVVNFLQSMKKTPGIQNTDVVLAVTTLSFDISVLEILLPLSTGACSVIVDQDTARDGQKLSNLISDSKATIMQGTPSTWRLLTASGWKGAPDLKSLCGGEPLPYDLIRELLPNVKELWNMYGPTETTVWSTCCRITDAAAPVFIGRPIANTKTFILDNSLQLVPIGVPGELFIGGIGLAEGYHKRTELTAEKFIANPYSDGLIYRTGDLARYRNDGSIEYLGRIDSQVKMRGFRVELGEIENVSLTFPDLRQCVAICKEFSPGDVRLLLYYSLNSSNSCTVTDLRKHLRKFLPEYMVPQHFMEMDSMPLTPGGKIDRKALPLHIATTAHEQTSDSEPQSQGEIYLAKIWREVLGINQIQKADNFFDIGGHSLLSIKVITRIKTEKGIDIHPRSMMLNSLSQIAALYFNDTEKNTEPVIQNVVKRSLGDKIRGFFIKDK
jgi:amino acid adenylation domain-containing protein